MQCTETENCYYIQSETAFSWEPIKGSVHAPKENNIATLKLCIQAEERG